MRTATTSLVLALLLAGCGGVPEDATGPEIYATSCARCHGSNLEGGVGPALGSGAPSVDQSDEYLTTTISRGKGRMPSFGSALSDDQIASVVAYIREQQGG